MQKCQYGVPQIFENEARGVTREIFNDVKFVLKVPIVNFIFRVLALYTDFLAIAWQQVRSNMLTVNMEEAAQVLRYPDISLAPPKIDWQRYYAKGAMEEINNIVFTFNYVNTKLLLIASAWAESLSSRPITGDLAVRGFINPGVIPTLPPIKLMRICDASPPVRHLLLDIAERHNAMDVASDFRALANYPGFLSLGWRHLRSYVGSAEYNILTGKLKAQAVKLVHRMPYPVTVNREQLHKYYSERDIAGIMGVVKMFQDFLPGLIVDGEFFRRILR